MARYTAIADVGNALVKLLRAHLVPEIIHNSNAIGLCNPSNRGDFIVGIYLYDVKEAEDIRVNMMISQSLNEEKYPPVHLSLYYMITVVSPGDVKFRSIEEQKILGKVVQTLHDYSCLDAESLESVRVQKPMDITIKMQPLELEEKMQIYQVPNSGYQLSLYYKVTPVEIESLKTRKTVRVMEVDFTVKEQVE